MDLAGGKYTWEKSRGKEDWVRERLDRAFATTEWWQKFPLCNLTVHHSVYSDHDPVLLELFKTDLPKSKFRFRFENIWLKEKKFHEEVSSYWRKLDPMQFLPKLLELSNFMEKWGRKFFNKFREKIKKQKEVLDMYERCANAEETARYFEEKSKLEDLLAEEELYWQQRAKSFWLTDGDSNTKYFHAFATTRKKKSVVSYLRNENEELVSNHEGMCNVVKSYFEKIFGQDSDLVDNDEVDVAAVISDTQNAMLEADFSFEEFSEALKQMHPHKSAGPDGLNPAFYQNFWKLIGKDIF